MYSLSKGYITDITSFLHDSNSISKSKTYLRSFWQAKIVSLSFAVMKYYGWKFDNFQKVNLRDGILGPKELDFAGDFALKCCTFTEFNFQNHIFLFWKFFTAGSLVSEWRSLSLIDTQSYGQILVENAKKLNYLTFANIWQRLPGNVNFSPWITR